MPDGGADIRFIRKMAGHAKLDTTEVYTRVSIRKLKEIHAAHPARREAAAKPSPETASDELATEDHNLDRT